MDPLITVISLGPGDPGLLNEKTLQALNGNGTLILRTAKHPLVPWLAENQIVFESLDHFYDEAEDFDSLNQSIAAYILHLCSVHHVVYAVPDAASDHTVRTLFRELKDHSMMTVIPGVGSFDLYMSSSLPFLSDYPVTVASAYDFLAASVSHNPKNAVLITEIDKPILAGDIKIYLSETLEDEHPVFLLNPDCSPVSMPLYMLDRQTDLSHRTALFVPGSDYRNRGQYVIQDLIEIMDDLRSPAGCSWDRKQTHHSLRPYLIEEAWECIASIDQNDTDHLCDELGDLLFQIIFHSSIGKSFDEFSFSDIVNSICRKMIRRHPHVFIQDSGSSAGLTWEQIKQQETGHTSFVDSLDDVSSGLPSLTYASKVMKKIYQAGVSERSAEEIISDIDRVIGKIRQDNESSHHLLGILLLLCSDLCGKMETDSELLLHETVDRLKATLKKNCQNGSNDGKTFKHLTFSELGVYLQYVKGEIE